MSQRLEFVRLCQVPGANISRLCRRFRISRQTGHKWIRRFIAAGAAGLADRSRRPHHTPRRTAATAEQLVVQMRGAHPGNGARKLHRRLCNLGHRELPAVSTVGRILQRHGLIEAAANLPRACQRFERPAPNQLWQMDFKGHFALARGGRCHPLTVLDDHSRYLLVLQACAQETTPVVREHLIHAFRCYGLPEQILCDNGPPWAGSGPELSALAVWLMRLGIAPIHGRPYHPQTQGKEERFHGSLRYELLGRCDWLDLAQAQPRFDHYRQDYNHDRPHHALGLHCPVSRYCVSPRSYPEQLPPLQYGEDELLRTVKSKGEITLRNRFFYIGRACIGLPLALRPTSRDGRLRVCLGSIALGVIELNAPLDRPKGHYFPMLPLSALL